MKFLIVILICLSSISISFSQIGKDCSNPLLINSLPYSASGLTTNGFGNDYTTPCGSCAATSWMSGLDFVFEYIPANNMNIDIKIPTTTSPSIGVGLYLVKGCPNDPLSQLIAKAENASAGNLQILGKPVLKDSVYFIIIDTYFIPPTYNQFTGFSINVNQVNSKDLEAIMLYEPRSGCEMTNSTKFVLQYKNVGTDTILNPLLGYQVNNDPPVYGTHLDTIIPYQPNYFTFLTEYDLSSPNTTYQIKIFTAYPGDSNTSNDTIFFPITNSSTINTFPYIQDFETNSVGWNSEWIDQTLPGTSWQWGTPSKPIINHAASGTKCWVTNTTGTNLTNETSYVLSPCFNFSSLALPLLEMDIWYETQSADVITVEYTTDNISGQNVNWHRLGNLGEGQNWYNSSQSGSSAWNGSSGGWLHSLHTLDMLVGEPFVKLRIVFRGGASVLGEGFAFDNIKISESPMNDLSVVKIKYPENSCGLSLSDSVKILIKNNGLNSQTNFVVKCSIDGGLTFVKDTVHNTLNFQDTLDYTFNSNFNFSSTGVYNLVTLVELFGDLNTANDTIKKQVMNYPIISSIPYVENFENNNGNWYSSGVNSSWEWGVPGDSLLTSAYSGQKCWATNLSGYNNMAEESFVESPCFDISQYKNPKIKFAVWYNQSTTSYCQFDTLSIGNEFGYFGSDTLPNWFNLGHAWSNSSNGWQLVSHQIKKFAGNSNLKFRFHFRSIVPASGFAFDSFTICDQPIAVFNEVNTIKGWQVQFDNTSTLMDSCKWNFGDGTFSNQINPVHPYASSDTVLVTLYVYNSCGVDSIKKWVHPKFVGISENEIDYLVNIYPNPVKDELNVEMLEEIGNCVIEINNVQGETVIFKNINVKQKSKILIQTNNLSSGLYFVKINSSKGIFNMKLVKL